MFRCSLPQYLRHVVTCAQVKAIVDSKLQKMEAAESSQSAASSPSSTSNILLVDVRSPQEVQQQGMIPTAINIPLNVVQEVLSDGGCSEEEFRETFHLEKPKPQTHQLIFYCQHGVRSGMAADIAESLGFRSVGNFPGSFAEWHATYIASKAR